MKPVTAAAAPIWPHGLSDISVYSVHTIVPRPAAGPAGDAADLPARSKSFAAEVPRAAASPSGRRRPRRPG